MVAQTSADSKPFHMVAVEDKLAGGRFVLAFDLEDARAGTGPIFRNPDIGVFLHTLNHFVELGMDAEVNFNLEIEGTQEFQDRCSAVLSAATKRNGGKDTARKCLETFFANTKGGAA